MVTIGWLCVICRAYQCIDVLRECSSFGMRVLSCFKVSLVCFYYIGCCYFFWFIFLLLLIFCYFSLFFIIFLFPRSAGNVNGSSFLVQTTYTPT